MDDQYEKIEDHGTATDISKVYRFGPPSVFDAVHFGVSSGFTGSINYNIYSNQLNATVLITGYDSEGMVGYFYYPASFQMHVPPNTQHELHISGFATGTWYVNISSHR